MVAEVEKGLAQCEHQNERSRCRECLYAGTGGGSFCIHEKIKSSCSICSPEKSYAGYVQSAKDRNLSFNLSLIEFEVLTRSNCHWCNETPAMGLDRVDNRVGYISTSSVRNVVPCCWTCNRYKGSLPSHVFVAHAIKIATHQKKQEALRKETPQVPTLPATPQAVVMPETQSPVV